MVNHRRCRRQYNEEAAADRLSEMTREDDPQTREDIERRLAELYAEDAAEDDVVENKGKSEREYKRDNDGKFAETDSLGDINKTQENGKEEDEYNDKPTTFWRDWAPMAQMEKMDENEAREKINKGISITDPT